MPLSNYMAILCVVIGFLLLLSELVLPWAQWRRAVEARQFHYTYRRFQAFALKKYHPAFQDQGAYADLSIDEINQRFNLEDSYNSLR